MSSKQQSPNLGTVEIGGLSDEAARDIIATMPAGTVVLKFGQPWSPETPAVVNGGEWEEIEDRIEGRACE